jgi:RecB family exonuclease
MKNIVWSASRIKKFHQCKNEYNLNYNVGVKADWASPHTTKGSAFHYIAEHYRDNESLSFDQWVTKLREYENYGKKLDIDSINLPELEAAFGNFKIFWKEFVVGGNFDQIHTEEKVEFSLDGASFQGVLDLVLIRGDEYIVLDYKTAKSGTGDHDLQLSVYIMAVHAKYAPQVPIKDFLQKITVYIYYPYAKYKSSPLETLKSIKLKFSDVDISKDSILQTIDSIAEETEWKPTVSYACQFCIFQGHADYCSASLARGFHKVRGLVYTNKSAAT